MPALPAITTAFLTRVKDGLSVGTDLATPGAGNIRGAADNYLRAQDCASVLELLQDALSNPSAAGVLTFTGLAIADEIVTIGTTVYTWKASPSAAFEVDIGGSAAACVTNLVAAINLSGTEGVEYGAGTTVHPDVSAADGAGDTVEVTAKAPGSPGNGIVTTTDLTNASWGAATTAGGSEGILLTAASNGTVRTFVEGASTFVANAHVGDTFTFDAGTTTSALQGLSFTVASNTTTTLTFEETMPAASASGDDGLLTSTSMQGAIDALRGGGGLADAPRGSVYGDMRTVADALNRLTELMGATQAERNLGRPGLVTAAGSTASVINVATQGVNMRIDEMRGAKVVVDSDTTNPRICVQNDENSLTLNKDLTGGIPAAAEAVVITVPADQAHKSYGKLAVHPGAQPGENIFLANLIQQAEDAVIAFTLPV